MHLPAIANRELLEVLLLLDKLCLIIASISSFGSECARYYWFPDGLNPYEGFVKSDNLISQFSDPERFSKILYEDCGLEAFDKQSQDKRFFEKLREEGNNQWWFALRELARICLKRRAHDIAYYNREVADITFPQPTVYGATARQVEELVDRMAAISLTDQREGKEEKINAHQWIQQQYESKKALIPMPEIIPPQAIAASDIEAVKKACLSEIYRSISNWDGKNALSVIEEFVEFRTLLSKPENYIKVRTGQFVERKIYTRSALDMKAEMVQKLASLSPYVDWTKILNAFGEVEKNKIKTFAVANRFEFNENYRDTLRIILEKNRELCCTRRDLIEKEINERQAKWREGMLSSSVKKAEDKKVARGQGKPPPPSSPV